MAIHTAPIKKESPIDYYKRSRHSKTSYIIGNYIFRYLTVSHRALVKYWPLIQVNMELVLFQEEYKNL